MKSKFRIKIAYVSSNGTVYYNIEERFWVFFWISITSNALPMETIKIALNELMEFEAGESP